ncbi:tRNA1(Val) (adenine(37)-N6)-methyltransferase [Pedobacter sp. GR22-6]|uniref:tRNA1(Val) (adenine(37)-N6)-methyltransferase n=1 Tax=Pedobacter sp. GR22-6 TaxID=3127957 RepID=UPI00307E7CB8
MSSVFKFKHFEVDQRGCAMKVNTDGVLLALLAEAEAPGHILDIGTGTGVLALILAQRFEAARIHAVEIDEQAALRASENFSNSIFSERMSVEHIAIEQYDTALRFDLILSNPPFFVNDLKNQEEKKGIARHASSVFFDELIHKVASLLSPGGQFWFILPLKQAEQLVEKAKLYKLSALKQIDLHSDENKGAFRSIICLGSGPETSEKEHFYIYEREKVYTLAYRDLLKDFFLAY